MKGSKPNGELWMLMSHGLEPSRLQILVVSTLRVRRSMKTPLRSELVIVNDTVDVRS